MKFIEVGGGLHSVLSILTHPYWKDKISEIDNFLPASIGSLEGEWQGWVVEIVPENLASLHKSHQENENINIIAGALDGKEHFTKVPIIHSKNNHAMAQLRYDDLDDPNTLILKPIFAYTFTLEKLFDVIGCPTLLRIDIEHAERQVLENYSWKHLPQFWQIDMHRNIDNINYAIDIFQKMNYRVLTTTGGDDRMEIWTERN